jgi:hypothetical protein
VDKLPLAPKALPARDNATKNTQAYKKDHIWWKTKPYKYF